MNQKIIDRLGLWETHLEIGKSFIYGVKIYQLRPGIYISKMDPSGQLCIDGIYSVHVQKNGAYANVLVSEDMLLDVEARYVTQLLTSWYDALDKPV